MAGTRLIGTQHNIGTGWCSQRSGGFFEGKYARIYFGLTHPCSHGFGIGKFGLNQNKEEEN